MINEEVKCDCECGETTCIECRAYVNYLVTPPSQPEAWENEFDQFYALPENMIAGLQREKAIKAFIKNLLSTQRKEHEKEFQDFITQLKKIDNIDNKLREVEQKLSKN